MLNGGKGNDRMKGGAGADVFKFVGDDIGDDHIIDFQDGVDMISLNFTRVEAIKAQNSDVLVEYDGGTILLHNMSVGDVTQADFI